MFRQVFGGRLGRFGQASELPAQAHIVESKKATTSASVKGGMMQEARFWSMTVPSASLVLNLDVDTTYERLGYLSSGNRVFCLNHNKSETVEIIVQH